MVSEVRAHGTSSFQTCQDLLIPPTVVLSAAAPIRNICRLHETATGRKCEHLSLVACVISCIGLNDIYVAALAWPGVCIDVGACVLALMFCVSHKRQVDCGLTEDLTY
jgi:hypothetical protein